MKGDCDEIIIVKNGLVPDTSFTNIAVNDGDVWLTPKQPLLMGTKRAQLLGEGKLREADITLEQLMKDEKKSLIKARNELGEREIAKSTICL